MTIELWVDRQDLRRTRVVEKLRQALEDGQIRVAIEKIGLTANNVSYAISGDQIGYWKYFPAEHEWGIVPGWGLGDVVESLNPDIAVGERLYGFFPMASEVLLTPGPAKDDFFVDVTPHRRELPALYNQYRRTQGEPAYLTELEDQRCLLFPLFVTSFVLYDYLIANEFFGAEQIVVGSASSKTGFGLAFLLHEDRATDRTVVGLTSPGNVEFLKALGCCDQIVTYGNEDEIDRSRRTAWVDMSGDGALTDRLHRRLGENMAESCIVGATHWESERRRSRDLPGAKPSFFFAPGHIAKRDADWGPGEIWRRGSEAGAKIAQAVEEQLTIERHTGAQDAAAVWKEMLDNAIPPSRGIMISLAANRS